jgi:malonyl-CoA decarboxylase
VKERRRRKPLDNVARFHVSNGAQVYRVNVGADDSKNGWSNSFGCMVNYRYKLDELEENQARYEQDYSLPLSEHMQALL